MVESKISILSLSQVSTSCCAVISREFGKKLFLHTHYCDDVTQNMFIYIHCIRFVYAVLISYVRRDINSHQIFTFQYRSCLIAKQAYNFTCFASS